MLLNILYYDQAAEAKGSQSTGGLAVGPLFITPQQVCSSRILNRCEDDGWCD